MPEREARDLWELRPLPAAVPRREDGGVVFSVQDRDVRVEGDAATVEGLVALCDGDRTLAEIAQALDGATRDDVHGLARALVDHGALVDCTQAYRVFHWQSSIESGFFRETDEATLAALDRDTFEPSRFAGPQVSLAPAPTAVGELVSRRASALPQHGHRGVSFAELSSLLAAMYAVGPATRRPVPSGGALYPLALHVLARAPVEPLQPGLWWYHPAAATLRLVRDDRLAVEEIFLHDPLSDAILGAGAPVVFISANLRRPSRVYANRGYRWALIEVGAVMQNVYLLATELGVPVRAIGGFHDALAHEFLELPDHVRPMLSLLLGA